MSINEIIPQNVGVGTKIKVIGVGNAGIKIAEKVAILPMSSNIEICGVDTDTGAIFQTSLLKKFVIGEEWTQGLGCGGDVSKAERAMSHKSNIAIKEFISNASLLVLISGFGGGTGTGGVPIIARFAKEKNIPVIIVATLPFSFEGHSKREVSENQVFNLMKSPYTVIPVPNDLLYSILPDTTPFEKAFSEVNMAVGKAIEGITELLKNNTAMPVDLCDLHNVLNKNKSECGIGIATIAKNPNIDNSTEIINKLLESPLLGGKERLKNADAIIASLTGGKDLTIGEMKNTFEKLKELTKGNVEVIVGANTNDNYANSLYLTVVAVVFDKSSSHHSFQNEDKTIHGFGKVVTNTAVIKTLGKLLSANGEQPELPFGLQNRGIFTSTNPTTVEGQDLDVPTFQRKNIQIEKN